MPTSSATLPGAPVPLHVHGLGRRLDTRWLFRDLAFDLPDGDVLWIQGPSGSGKSQLLQRVAGLVPGPGTVRWNDHDAETTPAPRWRRRVTYVAPELPRGIARDGRTLQARIEALATHDGPRHDPVALAASWGLEADAFDRPLHQLSSGEAQRLWLALVLAGDPELLLLDEPTRALDPGATAAVEAALAGRTALWVTHDPAQGERVATARLSLGGR